LFKKRSHDSLTVGRYSLSGDAGVSLALVGPVGLDNSAEVVGEEDTGDGSEHKGGNDSILGSRGS
jgi:hypothetical protein